jgi:hypothetical protein
MINDRFYNEQEIRQLIQSQAEQIRQLKKMLLQACSDFDYLSSHNHVECSHYLANGQVCGNCPLNSDGDECKWIFEPEALELIGGSENG